MKRILCFSIIYMAIAAAAFSGSQATAATHMPSGAASASGSSSASGSVSSASAAHSAHVSSAAPATYADHVEADAPSSDSSGSVRSEAVSSPSLKSSSYDSGSTSSVKNVDIGKYSFLSEYAASESAGGGVVFRSIKNDRLHVGLSFGSFLLFDGSEGRSDDGYLSREDSAKHYIGLSVAGKLGALNAMAGIHLTYNAHYLPIVASVGYDIEISSGSSNFRDTYYMRDPSAISNLGSSAELETVYLTVGVSSVNAIPLSSRYSFTTSLMADVGGSIAIPGASYLTLNVRFSFGWGHLFSRILDRRDFLAMNIMISASINVL